MSWLALILAMVAGLSAYLGSRHQRLLARPAPRRWSLAGFATTGSAAAILLAATLGPLASAFTLVMVLMIGLSSASFIGAALAPRDRK